MLIIYIYTQSIQIKSHIFESNCHTFQTFYTFTKFQGNMHENNINGCTWAFK